jgi:hypothetical protein
MTEHDKVKKDRYSFTTKFLGEEKETIFPTLK